jgi:hypothetical protein
MRSLVVFAPIRRLPTTGPALAPPPSLAPPNVSMTAPSPRAPQAAGHARVHRSQPAQASRRARDRSPLSPSGPPDPDAFAVATSAAPSGGGASAAMWCALVMGFALYAAQDLRRNRARLLLAGPAGVPSPQQRPG